MGISSPVLPKPLPDERVDTAFLHYAVETTFWGLIDDFYIQWKPHGELIRIDIQS